MEWMILMDSFDTATANLPDDDYKLIKYEDLCGDVSGVMKSVTDFCELDWAPEFDHCMKGYSLRCANDKYKTELNETQQRDLEKVLTNYLHRYGYA